MCIAWNICASKTRKTREVELSEAGLIQLLINSRTKFVADFHRKAQVYLLAQEDFQNISHKNTKNISACLGRSLTAHNLLLVLIGIWLISHWQKKSIHVVDAQRHHVN